ncbi:MAG: hypothetical protein B6I35_11455 [Anaerolineaceae bacterium 4572_32.2]|nr:MAG: hypothetical protein B6I35_11455 [Anaerolineaceae bacterium 4572_32.2]
MPLRFVTVDLKQTKIYAVRFTDGGLQEARVALSTNPQEGVDAGLRRIRSAIRQVWPMQDAVTAIGLSVPGILDFKRGVLRSASDLPGWLDVPFRDTLVETFGVPTFVGKAAGVAALAEHRFGVGQGVADMVYIAVGETLESGVILDNRLFTGGNGLGGEIGHIAVALHDSKPVRRNVAYLETLLSNRTLLRRVRERVANGERSLLPEMLNGNLALLTVEVVCEAARQGDVPAMAVLAETGTYLGVAIVSLMHLLNPALFVLDGIVKFAGDALLSPMRRSIAVLASETYQEHTRTVLAQFGNDIGSWGALALCLMELSL